jgi:hypothetical protein
VTGRSGSDVLLIVRNVLKKYKALDTVAKPDATPSMISNLLMEAVNVFHGKNKTPAAREILRGSEMAWDWDDKILRATGIKGGAAEMYDFLDRLFASYIPVVPDRELQNVQIHAPSDVAYGRYWSRAVGCPVYVYFGRKSAIASAADDRALAPPGMLDLRSDDLLSRESIRDVEGYVYRISGATRSQFSNMV